MKERRPRRRPASASQLTLAGALTLSLALVINHYLLEADSPANMVAERAEARDASSPSFDYYVLALSWSPDHCQDKPQADQCAARRTFIMHGLWPQFERGFPTDCPTPHERPTRRQLRAFADLTASEGLLAYQWRKHGVCAGLSAEVYLATARRAVDGVKIPDALQNARRDARVDPKVIESAFLLANPQLSRNGVTIKCKDGDFSKVRICLTKDLEPRDCGRDVARDCGARSVDLIAPK